MKTKFLFVIIASLLAQTISSPASTGFIWEDEDSYFSTSQKPSTTTQTFTTFSPLPTTTTTFNSKPTTVTTTVVVPIPSTTRNPNYRRCVKRCPSLSNYDPVCGTDNMNYNNESKLYCARKCGRQVDKLSDGLCSPPPSSTTQSSVTPQSACFKRCPKTAEYNPVCGTNNMAYQNKGHLKCAQQCGVDVQKRSDGTCASTRSQTTATPQTTTLSSNFKSCTRQCIVSSEYKPVCGSDGTTYNNDSEIMCDISCGRNVRKIRNGSC